MTPTEQLNEIKKRLQARRDSYRKESGRLSQRGHAKGAIEYATYAGLIGEALGIVVDVEEGRPGFERVDEVGSVNTQN